MADFYENLTPEQEELITGFVDDLLERRDRWMEQTGLEKDQILLEAILFIKLQEESGFDDFNYDLNLGFHSKAVTRLQYADKPKA